MNNPFLARSVSQFRLEQRSLSVGKNFGLAKTLAVRALRRLDSGAPGTHEVTRGTSAILAGDG